MGYYSDAYKLEFVLPKFNMFRRVLAETLADDRDSGAGLVNRSGSSNWPGWSSSKIPKADFPTQFSLVLRPDLTEAERGE